VLWLMQTGYQPFAYAYAVHGSQSRFGALLSVPGYLAGAVGYVAVAIAVYALVTRPRLADFLAALWPRDPDRRLLATLLWAPLLLPAVTAPLLNVELTSLWVMQAWFLLPVLLLMPETVAVTRNAAVKVAFCVAALALVALLISPVLAYVKHTQGAGQGRAYYSPLADELTRRWHALTPQPLNIVVGEQDYAVAASFYAPDHPDVLPGFNFQASPWVTPARLEREGFAVICLDQNCAALAMQLAKDHPGARQEDVEVVRRFFGSATPPARFIVVLAPPRPWSSSLPRTVPPPRCRVADCSLPASG